MSDKVFQNISNRMASCACCTPHGLQPAAGLDRRSFLGWGAAGALASGLSLMAPQSAWAASGQYESMLVNCIDPRFTTLSWQYMGLLQGVSRDKLEDNYSHFVMAGGPIGAVHPKFEAWHKNLLGKLGHHCVLAPNQARCRFVPPRLWRGETGFWRSRCGQKGQRICSPRRGFVHVPRGREKASPQIECHHGRDGHQRQS
jgi:hypothetical protein